ncbi:MAG: IPT/TIG domain-containing protein [Chloroflexi bacterium]|nr:IPT/TIG domain-containing protein [Chloroflexota bacterium]MBU1748324.1 IPT/TIG domain-containing protein [Chloroflexota bacterium]
MNKRSFASVATALLSITALLILLALMAWTSSDVPTPAQAAPLLAVPTVTEVDPSSAPNDLDTSLVVTGTGFTTTSLVLLGDDPLGDVGWVSSVRLTATVSWGLDPGVYNLTVVNPGEGSGSLPNAFTVTQGIGVWNAGELYGGEVQQVVVNPITPTTIYARSDRVGLFRSRDGGASWSLKYASTNCGNLAIDRVSPNHIYLHSLQGLCRSDDEGDTWVPLIATFPITQTSGSECWGNFGIYPHPSNPGTVYFAACGTNGGESGLIVSTNWGQDWEPAINGLTDTQVTALAFHPDDPDIMYLGTASGNIFHSSDGGASWTYASRPLEYVRILAVNPFGDHEVWTTSRDEYGAPCALLKSTNADLTTWTTMEPVPGQPMCAWSIEFVPTISGTVFLGGFGHGYKTTDGGASWVPFGGEAGQRGWIHDIALHPTAVDTIYLAGYVHGVHKTTDGGASWQVVNQGLTAMFPQQLDTVPGQPEVVYAQVNTGDIYRATQGGATWQRLPVSNTASILVDPVTPMRVYAGVSGRVYVSTDGGSTWPTYGELVPPPPYTGCNQFPKALLSIPGQPGTLLAGIQHWCGLPMACPGSIYRSTDYGGHWGRVYPTHTQEISQVHDLVYDPGNPTVIYAATGELDRGGGIFKSIDGGVTWGPVGVGQIDYAQDIVVEPGTYRVFASQRLLPLYVSNDGGVTWVPTGFGGGHNVHDILFAPGVAPGDPPVLYDAAVQGLYRSTDGAQSWQRAAGELGHVPVYSLAVVTATGRVILYAGTAGGAAVLTDTGTTLVGSGVYRWTSRLLTSRLYLPLAFRG